MTYNKLSKLLYIVHSNYIPDTKKMNLCACSKFCAVHDQSFNIFLSMTSTSGTSLPKAHSNCIPDTKKMINLGALHFVQYMTNLSIFFIYDFNSRNSPTGQSKYISATF